MADEVNTLGNEYPEIYQHLCAIVVEACQGSGLEPGRAAAIGQEVTNQFRVAFGGETLYVPKVAGAVHEEIFKRWKAGADPKELAREYDYSQPHLNFILREMKRRHFKRLQKGLFDGLDPTP